jgi:hypothetical protein
MLVLHQLTFRSCRVYTWAVILNPISHLFAEVACGTKFLYAYGKAVLCVLYDADKWRQLYGQTNSTRCSFWSHAVLVRKPTVMKGGEQQHSIGRKRTDFLN